MKKTKFIAMLAITLIFFYALTGCGKKEGEVKNDKQKTEQKHEEHTSLDTAKIVKDGAYFCSMHPLIQSNEPGKCPICNMDLITKKEYNEKMMKKHEELEAKFASEQNAMHFEIKTSTLKSWECENAIKKALKNTPGVMGYSTDILECKVHLYIDKSKTSKKDVEKVISDLGFDANDTKANQQAAANLPAECK